MACTRSCPRPAIITIDGLCIVVTHDSGNSDRDATLGGNAGLIAPNRS